MHCSKYLRLKPSHVLSEVEMKFCERYLSMQDKTEHLKVTDTAKAASSTLQLALTDFDPERIL